LDPEYPAQRIAHILADCGARALITVAALSGLRGKFSGTIIALDAQAAEIDCELESRLAVSEIGTKPDGPCYVIYTSGSTGRPKGVLMEHRSACNLVRAEAEIFRVRPSDRVYQGFSIAFDASVEEIWLAFFSGAALVVGTHQMLQSGPALSR